VVELTKGLENNVVSAMSIKVDDKEAEKTNWSLNVSHDKFINEKDWFIIGLSY
jgi:hypothetical protein